MKYLIPIVIGDNGEDCYRIGFRSMGYDSLGDCLSNSIIPPRPTFPPYPSAPTSPPPTFSKILPYNPGPKDEDNIFEVFVGWLDKGFDYFTGGINRELFRLLFTGWLVFAVWRFIKRWKQRRNREG